MFVKRVSITILICIVLKGWVFAQPFNAYVEHNYTVEDFKNSRQSWAVIQADDGKMVFGNSNAINLFDGEQWHYIHVPIGQTTYSLAKSDDGRIYTGGEGDIGYLSADEHYQMEFKSLLPRLDSTKHDFQFVRQTHYLSNQVYFRTRTQLMMYNAQEDTVLVYNPGVEIYNSYLIKDKVYVQVEGKGLVDITNLKETVVDSSSYFLTDRVFGMLPTEQGLIIYFREHGLQRYYGELFTSFSPSSLDYLSEHKGYRMLQLTNNRIAIATLSGGIMFLDGKGQLLQILTQHTGLNDDHVYDLFQDNQGLLWAMLDDGISVIDVNSSFNQYDINYGIDGLVNGVFQQSDEVTVTTNNGFYYWDGKATPFFRKVDRSPEHSFVAIQLQDKVVSSSQAGLYVIENGNATKKSDLIFPRIIANGEASFIGWGSGSLSLFDYKNEQLHLTKTYADILYPKSWVLDEGQLYILTINGQLLRVSLSSGVIYNIETESVSSEKLYIGKIGTSVMLGAMEGIFKVEKNKIIPSDGLFSNLENITLFQDCGDELWIRSGTELVRFARNGDSWDKEVDEFNSIGADEGFFSMSCYPTSTWFGLENKIIQIPKQFKQDIFPFQTNITSVVINSDSLIYNGFGSPDEASVLEYRNNQMRFSFAAASFLKADFNSYQYKLEGFDEEWSNWTSESQKDYTNIPEGDYTFKVRGRNIYKKVGREAAFQFQILPPWYRSWWAYLMYLSIISAILYFIHRVRVNQILKVERVRNRIAGDLHDEVSATLSSIYYFAEAIERYPEQSKSGRFVRLILESAFEAKEKITDIVWSINPEYDDWQDFLVKCRRHTSDLLESKNIKYDLKIQGDAKGKMDMEFRQHIWLIFKEILTNSVRHAEPSRVDVILSVQSGKLTLVIQDDGKGFDVKNTAKGNGLASIQKRAAQINADVELNSEKDFGTRWVITTHI